MLFLATFPLERSQMDYNWLTNQEKSPQSCKLPLMQMKSDAVDCDLLFIPVYISSCQFYTFILVAVWANVVQSVPVGVGSIQDAFRNNSITSIYRVPCDEGPGLLAVLFYYRAAHEKNNFLSAHHQNGISID